jgi:uncharacterized membrane protein
MTREKLEQGGGVAPAWVRIAAPALCLAGLAAAAYLTAAHFDAAVILACPEKGIVNCAAVTTSPQSSLLGVPVALLGLAWFLAITPLHLPAAWNSPRPAVRGLRVATAGAGMAMVLYLAYTELFILHAICLWCTAVHLITLALFVVTLAGTARTANHRTAHDPQC